MTTHYCKVGNTRPNLKKRISLKDLEDKYRRFIEEAYNLEQTDLSMSDTLFFEAQKLKKRIINLK